MADRTAVMHRDRFCRWLTLLALLAAGHSQVAAQSLRFASDVDAAIKTARREDRPLMFYLVDRSRRGNEDLRRRQSRVFRDLRVRRAAAPFVGVELAIDQHPELSRRWQLAPRTDGLVLFADATGEKLHATQTGDANAFLRELNRARRAFAANAWEQRLAARLRDPATPAPELCAALRRVGELEIRDADVDIVAVLRRPSPDEQVALEAFRALARLSTPLAIRTLVAHARENPAATAALDACSPAGAAQLAQWLGQGDPALDAAIYAAVTRACNVPEPRTARFWHTAAEPARRAEIHRVRRIARAAALREHEQQGG